MDLKEIQEFIKNVDGWSSIEMTDGDFSIKIQREVCAQPVVYSLPAQVTASGENAQDGPGVQPGQDNAKSIASPLVGIFHDLEGARKVAIGSKLKKGQVICNIEAMKLMNEIAMPEDGEITWIACSEGDTVEYDQLLFRYV